MQPVNALKSAFQNFVNFSGRASRGDYWWYVLAYIIVAVVLGILDGVLFGGGSATMDTTDGVSMSYSAGLLVNLWMLANLIPSIAITARRLHDSDRSGWWQLIAIIPLVGWLVLLYWVIIEGTKGDNRFGPAVTA